MLDLSKSIEKALQVGILNCLKDGNEFNGAVSRGFFHLGDETFFSAVKCLCRSWRRSFYDRKSDTRFGDSAVIRVIRRVSPAIRE